MRKLIKSKKKILILFIFAVLISVWCVACTMTAYYEPEAKQHSIAEILQKEALSSKDYADLFEQTGLSELAINDLIEDGRKTDIEEFAEQYFETPEYDREFLFFPIVATEQRTSPLKIAPLRRGDVLVSLTTHTLGFRHGHAAIVVNGETGKIIEHMVLGEVSAYSYISGWKDYTTLAILRHSDSEKAEKAAEYAESRLVGIPYNPLAGVLKKNKSDEKNISSSHCSHLVWQAYMGAGVDIDGNGGAIVLPGDFLKSDKLEIVQIIGITPSSFSHK